MFKCDPHVHTDESSICGKIPAKEVVNLYKNAGFDTIFITDHVDWRRFDERPNCTLQQYVEDSLIGYKIAKQQGDKIGITVLWSTEIMLRESKNHFLVYGVKPEDIWTINGLFELTSKELYDIIKSKGGYMIQAHPYRDEVCYPAPQSCDAIEVYNSHPRHRNYNEEAFLSSIKYDKPQTAGSDSHQLPDIGLSGVLTKTKITSVADYINAVQNKELEIIW